jgi:hypothetical protein
MSTHHEFYLERASAARREAGEATLDNVRDRCLRAAAAWDEMASRAARTERMRAETEARKASEALAQSMSAPVPSPVTA